MPDSDAEIDALFGKKVTITIAEKSESGSPASSDSTIGENAADTFIIENDKKILTITIAE